MKRFCAVIAFAAVLLAFSPAVRAQKFVPAEVKISKSTVVLQGRTYYVHQVEAKQTLYSICKAYNADLDEVREINADELGSGLKAGSMLLIPADGQPQKTEAQTVAKEEPRQEEVKSPEKTSSSDVKYIKHRVKWYDSLLMLALKYKVSQEDIIEFNNLDSKTLVVGQILKIPVGELPLDDVDGNDIIETPEDDELGDVEQPSITITDNPPLFDEDEEMEEAPAIIPFTGTARLALMLPFASGSSSPSGNFLDFYAGVMIALEDLRKDGTNITLKVIDMADYDGPEQMMATTPLDLDFIIGNFSTQSIEPAATWCDKHHIPLVSPLDQKIEAATYDHRYLINAPLSSMTQTMRLAESIHYNPRKDNVIVVCENSEQMGQFHKDLVASLDSLNIPFATVRAGISRGSGESIRNALVQGKKNHIIITSEKEAIAADAVRNIGQLANSGNYNIAGYASHRIRRFESIDADALKGMNANFCMNYYVDYNDDEVQDFVRRYRAQYSADPGNFAFQGYDIATYFVSALKRYGSDMINGIGHYPAQGLQLNFRFDRRNDRGGMFNEATKNLSY